jgi:hypothetical protein
VVAITTASFIEINLMRRRLKNYLAMILKICNLRRHLYLTARNIMGYFLPTAQQANLLLDGFFPQIHLETGG